MKKNLLCLSLFGALALVVGCRTTESSSSGSSTAAAEPAKAKKEEAKPSVPVPADSPFAKIKPGMGMNEVYALIGQPTDTSSHITGKSFIPYYYGGDTHRMEAIYKGQGRIVFSPRHAFTGDMEVVEINYNPNERGFK
ncbi:MAG: hypothetical protein U1F65_10660 [Verrucomicrobiota bacterium]